MRSLWPITFIFCVFLACSSNESPKPSVSKKIVLEGKDPIGSQHIHVSGKIEKVDKP